MRLRDLGLNEYVGGEESVTMLVGPNGSGKSSALLRLARTHRRHRKVYVVCNTPHDRFAGLRGVPRISAANSTQTPKQIVKQAVRVALSGPGSAFYQISAILDYCGYRPRFGFAVDPGRRFRQLRNGELRADLLFDEFVSRSYRSGVIRDDFEKTLAYLARLDPDRPLWIDATESALEFSQSREFGALLELEGLFRHLGLIRGTRVFLQRNDGDEIEMKHASSGQLALISSLLFLITNVEDGPVIIIDEPENSLHPRWQQEYVDKLLAALRYRNATVIVATHAPMVVTGALASNPGAVSVFEVRNGVPQRLVIDGRGPAGGIEEILWRAFDVVTPANHFVSEEIVGAISRFENGEESKGSVLHLVDMLDDRSFDPRQKRYFEAVRGLVDRVQAALDGGGADG